MQWNRKIEGEKAVHNLQLHPIYVWQNGERKKERKKCESGAATLWFSSPVSHICTEREREREREGEREKRDRQIVLHLQYVFWAGSYATRLGVSGRGGGWEDGDSLVERKGKERKGKERKGKERKEGRREGKKRGGSPWVQTGGKRSAEERL